MWARRAMARAMARARARRARARTRVMRTMVWRTVRHGPGPEDGEGQAAKEGNDEVVVVGKGQQGKAEIPAALAVAVP